MRFKTALEADCWRKRVMSWLGIEKLCQLMIVPGVLVTVRVLPCVAKLAWPRVTVGPVGFACANSAAKHDATASANNLRSHAALDLRLFAFIPSPETAQPPGQLWTGATPALLNHPKLRQQRTYATTITV